MSEQAEEHFHGGRQGKDIKSHLSDELKMSSEAETNKSRTRHFDELWHKHHLEPLHSQRELHYRRLSFWKPTSAQQFCTGKAHMDDTYLFKLFRIDEENHQLVQRNLVNNGRSRHNTNSRYNNNESTLISGAAGDCSRSFRYAMNRTNVNYYNSTAYLKYSHKLLLQQFGFNNKKKPEVDELRFPPLPPSSRILAERTTTCRSYPTATVRSNHFFDQSKFTNMQNIRRRLQSQRRQLRARKKREVAESRGKELVSVLGNSERERLQRVQGISSSQSAATKERSALVTSASASDQMIPRADRSSQAVDSFPSFLFDGLESSSPESSRRQSASRSDRFMSIFTVQPPSCPLSRFRDIVRKMIDKTRKEKDERESIRRKYKFI